MPNDVASIPDGFEVESSPANKPSNIPEGFEVESHGTSDPSVIPPPSKMDPNANVSTFRRAANAFDTAVQPRNAVPLAVGAATAGAAMLATDDAPLAVKLGLSAAGGFAAPYTEAAASKAMGGNPEVPSAWDALKSAGMNMAFEGAAAKEPGKISQAARDVRILPKSEQTIAQLTQQMRNTDFLKASGFKDEQIAEILKDPEAAARRLQRSIDQGNQVADTFKQTVTNERGAFKTRYDSALGDRATAPVDPKAIATQMRQIAGGAGQHELTPTFQKFLERKADEIDPPQVRTAPTASMKVKVGDLGTIDVNDPKNTTLIANYAKKLDPSNPKELKVIQQLDALGIKPQAEAKPFTTQDARDLNTEIRENFPGQATNLDKQAIAKLDEGIKNEYHKGWTQEQIGQEEGIDKDYAMFQKTINGLRPNRDDFGEQTADAFFQTAKTNPTLALNFARMAEDAGKMPEFRDAFQKQIVQEMSGAGGGPINQMKVLQKLQTDWRTTEDGKAVLRSVFGKDSPLADPVEMSKYLGSLNQPATQDAFSRAGRTMGNVGFSGRQLVIMSMLGGASIYALRDHPEKIPAALAALGTLAVAGPLMSRLSSGAQRSMISMLAAPSPETINKFFRVAGPALTAGFSEPNDLATESGSPK